ncbi:hypothetical protein ACN265_22605 [Micromonospora sp. WMMD730]|uniref:hypothetical protein n=1 Tax=Micromonospora sp. WMMD730 TaxID=3404128 RepID=UPI003B952971
MGAIFDLSTKRLDLCRSFLTQDVAHRLTCHFHSQPFYLSLIEHGIRIRKQSTKAGEFFSIDLRQGI